MHERRFSAGEGSARRACLAAVGFGLAWLVAGCSTVDLGEGPVDPGRCQPSRAYFEDVLWPEYIAPANIELSCVGDSGCHRLDDGLSALRLSVDEPVDFTTNYNVVTRFIKCGAFESSPLLTRPLFEVDPHGGGELFDIGSPQELVFLNWITAR